MSELNVTLATDCDIFNSETVKLLEIKDILSKTSDPESDIIDSHDTNVNSSGAGTNNYWKPKKQVIYTDDGNAHVFTIDVSHSYNIIHYIGTKANDVYTWTNEYINNYGVSDFKVFKDKNNCFHVAALKVKTTDIFTSTFQGYYYINNTSGSWSSETITESELKPFINSRIIGLGTFYNDTQQKYCVNILLENNNNNPPPNNQTYFHVYISNGSGSWVKEYPDLSSVTRTYNATTSGGSSYTITNTLVNTTFLVYSDGVSILITDYKQTFTITAANPYTNHTGKNFNLDSSGITSLKRNNDATWTRTNIVTPTCETYSREHSWPCRYNSELDEYQYTTFYYGKSHSSSSSYFASGMYYDTSSNYFKYVAVIDNNDDLRIVYSEIVYSAGWGSLPYDDNNVITVWNYDNSFDYGSGVVHSGSSDVTIFNLQHVFVGKLGESTILKTLLYTTDDEYIRWATASDPGCYPYPAVNNNDQKIVNAWVDDRKPIGIEPTDLKLDSDNNLVLLYIKYYDRYWNTWNNALWEDHPRSKYDDVIAYYVTKIDPTTLTFTKGLYIRPVYAYYEAYIGHTPTHYIYSNATDFSEMFVELYKKLGSINSIIGLHGVIYRTLVKPLGIYINKSSNFGVSWSDDNLIKEDSTAKYPTLLLENNSNYNLWMFYQKGDNIVKCYSTDEGDSFSSEEIIVAGKYPVSINLNTGIMLLYYFDTDCIKCMRSTNYGTSWLEAAFVAIPSTDNPSESPIGVVVSKNSSQKVIVSFIDKSGNIKTAEDTHNGLGPYTIL